MAREHARISLNIWAPGDDFRDLTPDAQRLYFLLISQQQINNAGVIPLLVRKWARCSAHTSEADIEKALTELAEHRFVLADWDTDELLVRTFIRGDGVAKVPNVLKNALKLAVQVESPTLRKVLAVELRRLDPGPAWETAAVLDPDGVENPSPNPSGKGSGNPSSEVETNPSPDPETNPSPSPAGWGRGRGGGRGSASEGGWGGGSRERAREARPTAPNLDPANPRCGEHAHIPATERGPDCRACGAVRRQVAETPAAPDPDRAARRAAINACSRCDDFGHVQVTPESVARCDHRPDPRTEQDRLVELDAVQGTDTPAELREDATA